MSDGRNNAPQPKSNSGVIFIVGGLVVAVGVLAYVLTGGTMSDSESSEGGSTPAAVSIENNTTVPAAEPAPAAPAAEPAPAAPAAPAAEPAPAAPAAPAVPAAPANP